MSLLGTSRWMIALLAAGVFMNPERVLAADFHNVQVYAMEGRETLHVVDFHYESKKACTKALADRAALFRQQQPNLRPIRGYCTTRLEGRMAGMIRNNPVGWPYVSFQDMRQWIEGGSTEKARKFCADGATSSGFAGAARCIQ